MPASERGQGRTAACYRPVKRTLDAVWRGYTLGHGCERNSWAHTSMTAKSALLSSAM
jgi:hypothetical protein